MSPATGSAGLAQAIVIADQVTALLTAGVPLIGLGKNVYELLKALSTGADQNTTEEGQAASTRLKTALDIAIDRNDDWRATHPRTS